MPSSLEDARHAQHVVGLEAEVHLLVQRAGEVLCERTRRADRSLRDALEDLTQQQEGAQVVAHAIVEAGPLDLDDDFGAVEQAGGMHLPDGRRGDRLVVEPRERRAERTTEIRFDDVPRFGSGEGRNPVAQRRELGRPLRWEQARARRDDLAHLDVGRAERGEGLPDATGQRLLAPRHVPGERRAHFPRPFRRSRPGSSASIGDANGESAWDWSRSHR